MLVLSALSVILALWQHRRQYRRQTPAEGERFFGERIRGYQIIVAVQPPPPEQPPHPYEDGGEEPGDLLIAGRRGGMEADAAGGRVGEHPVEDEGVEVDVEEEIAMKP